MPPDHENLEFGSYIPLHTKVSIIRMEISMTKIRKISHGKEIPN
jgi:hypothetical protein|tara:strand:+ start:26 stop:157 length:132 start_codon:yes stop_codon:yes gene_type:complete